MIRFQCAEKKLNEALPTCDIYGWWFRSQKLDKCQRPHQHWAQNNKTIRSPAFPDIYARGGYLFQQIRGIKQKIPIPILLITQDVAL